MAKWGRAQMSLVTRVGRMILKAVSPRLHASYSKYRNTSLFDRMNCLMFQLTGGLVAQGPFAGMRYLSSSVGSALAPKLVGSYEEEIQPWIEDSITKGYELVIDVGCAEGYYAVGMAIRMLNARVIAYDVSEVARRLCRELAHLNDVGGRVEVRGQCKAAELDNVIAGKCLLICDCEGAEVEFLDPVQVPALAGCDLIVETHDAIGAPSSGVLKDRFSESHRLQSMLSRGRTHKDYSVVMEMPSRYRAVSVSELRPEGQEWLWLISKGD